MCLDLRITTSAPKYKVEHCSISIDKDDYDARFSVRRNGKVFYVSTSPSHFSNSPLTRDKYFKYIDVLKSGEEVVDDVFDTDVYEWVVTPFEPLLLQLALDPVQEDLATTRVTLQQQLFPEFFVFELDIVNERLCPRRILQKDSPSRPSFVFFDDDFLDELEEWTAFYDPARITFSFPNPQDALFKPPRKVLIENDKVECFFKPCYSTVEKRELNNPNGAFTALVILFRSLAERREYKKTHRHIVEPR